MHSMLMEPGTVAPVPLLRPMRVLLGAFGVLTLLAVAALFVRPEATDRFFAWTVLPPLTAAFLGAAYAAGCALVVLSLRSREWAHARASIITILIFTVLTLCATLAHLDRFHFGADGTVARAAAWFWLAVYVLVPLILVVLLVLQGRAPGTHPPRQRRLPRSLAAALAVQGAVMLVTGVLLFARPGLLGGWPWVLTPLTSRAVGAWLISFGVAAVAALVENDLARLRAPAIAYLVFAVAELVALLRFTGEVRWGPAAWSYLAFLVFVGATGVAGVRLSVDAPPTHPGSRAPAEVRRA
jgi:hypothetical protein